MARESECTFYPGDRVVFDGAGKREHGVIVHAWRSAELAGLEECYVAFFGPDFPDGDASPAAPPYVLRYAASSLRRC